MQGKLKSDKEGIKERGQEASLSKEIAKIGAKDLIAASVETHMSRKRSKEDQTVRNYQHTKNENNRKEFDNLSYCYRCQQKILPVCKDMDFSNDTANSKKPTEQAFEHENKDSNRRSVKNASENYNSQENSAVACIGSIILNDKANSKNETEKTFKHENKDSNRTSVKNTSGNPILPENTTALPACTGSNVSNDKANSKKQTEQAFQHENKDSNRRSVKNTSENYVSQDNSAVLEQAVLAHKDSNDSSGKAKMSRIKTKNNEKSSPSEKDPQNLKQGRKKDNEKTHMQNNKIQFHGVAISAGISTNNKYHSRFSFLQNIWD
ncbi:hypothetical protein QYM36_019596 [Artemia franciscana]|uniref:Uncharacterized protein n=1 Tax=Artemia franciscana TaxID=6661 RepID=A0AA88H518_ARTSF|nr:hypothetical protein QYM36_019596 [Artemia franciscana]